MTARVRIGQLEVDALTLPAALAAVERLVEAGTGGTIVTPNVDHVVNAETDEALRAAYAAANLSLADGMPILWAARLLGHPLPAKLSGSDLVVPIARRAAAHGWRVYLCGGGPGVAAEAAARLHAEAGVAVAGTDAPRITLSGPDDDGGDEGRLAVARIRAARPHLVYVGLGSPKQEIWMRRIAPDIRPAVSLGIGASLDFLAGRVHRAPGWVSAAGLEWAYRLAHEPRRLWRRYLVRDPRFFAIVLRMLLEGAEVPSAGGVTS